MLSGPHLSKLQNPLMAETFHRTGAVEIWGRGTNRVIEECERYGIEPPSFEEQAGAVAPGRGTGRRPRVRRQWTKMLDTTPDFLPARMINEYVYWPQLAYLEWVRREWDDNADTVEGRFARRLGQFALKQQEGTPHES